MKSFDIIIVGGAMTGSTLALALAKKLSRPISIALVEASDISAQNHPGFDSRSIALSYGTKEILNNIGLWNDIKPIGSAISTVHVSDQGHAGQTVISKDDVALSSLGYVVELEKMGQVFYSQLDKEPAITLFYPDSVSAIHREAEHVDVSLQSGEVLRGSLLVAADGGVSSCCQLVNIDADIEDFHQSAIIANVTASEAHDGRAFERFTSHGPIALLPMTEGRMSLVWCVDPADSEALMNASDSVFLAKLQQEFGWRLGAFQFVGKRACYPLKLSQRTRLVSHRFVVVGNAAQTLHPIAGQGFNLGIRDVASLVETLSSVEGDMGEYAVLSRYQASREPDRNNTVQLTSSLVHLFSNQWLATKLGRNIGLLLMNNIPRLREPLLTRTLGRLGRGQR